MELDITRIKYSDFVSKETYCKLQEYFGRRDYKRMFDQISSPLENFEITLLLRDDFNSEEEYVNKEFLKDFLEPGIAEMRDRYFEEFKKQMELNSIFTEDQREGFLKLKRSKILRSREEITKNEYLPQNIVKQLETSLEELEEILFEYLDNPFPEIKTKIQFNWSRTEIEYFFYLLRANKAINWIEDKDIGRIIDGTMEYLDGDEYKPIHQSRKHLNDFKNKALRPVTKANDKLRDVFRDFFHY